MKARLNAQEASPAAYRAMTNLGMFIRKEANLEPSLVELVKMRASQINGCAYCIDIHSKDARIRAAPVCAYCVARDAVLHPTRARSIGMD